MRLFKSSFMYRKGHLPCWGWLGIEDFPGWCMACGEVGGWIKTLNNVLLPTGSKVLSLKNWAGKGKKLFEGAWGRRELFMLTSGWAPWWDHSNSRSTQSRCAIRCPTLYSHLPVSRNIEPYLLHSSSSDVNIAKMQRIEEHQFRCYQYWSVPQVQNAALYCHLASWGL